MAQANGFTYEVVGETVVISHHGRRATVLRGARASEFLDEVDDDADLQGLMARLTGNYRRGNEREARQHPRNRGAGR
ncbi:hypothetical protein C8046_10950 [Serinibacter arcticus]|uniref:Uncharacterized protein n=1 Tax=Serinibacter arcticus TaxID=1655435 RepID=A0A2U1ZVR7_9MICO|nr:hypothetical protein [Serinibacter arcticus]PWD51087.1 hypothetical protein C8046_10950 [Serinibacter arcticus]